jgi:thymidylate kinase
MPKYNEENGRVLTSTKQREIESTADGRAGTRSERVRILLRVFGTLERAGVLYCVLHGYEDFLGDIKSDVDCIIGRNTRKKDLLALFHRNRDYIGAEIVRCLGYYFVFAGRNADGSRCFLTLDCSFEYDVNDLPLYNGKEILGTRRRHQEFYIPAIDVEFGVLLTRSIAKLTLDDERGGRLSKLFKQDPNRCSMQAVRHWRHENVERVIAAARSGDWTPVRGRLNNLHGELRRRVICARPARFVANKFRGLLGRTQRLLQPEGLSVVFLGPDGAGKSSVIDVIGPKLVEVFPRWKCFGFAPGLLAFFRRGKRSTSDPHGLVPRSVPVSLMRAAYWFAYQTLGFLTLRVALGRSTLVLFDRHFVDILVDQKRYRYGGPIGLLRLLWRLIPKPDLIILLDAPTEVLHSRKQEVPFEVTASQRNAYLALIRILRNGHIVDASQSPAHVADAVEEVILKYAAERLRRRQSGLAVPAYFPGKLGQE